MATDISLSGALRPITIDQGSTAVINFGLKDEHGAVIDMSGYDLRLQVRPSYSSSVAIINCTLANQKLAWVYQEGGTFKLVLSPTDTSSIPFPKANPEQLEAVYDLEVVTDTGVVSKPVRGTFTINREVTR